MKKMLFLFLLFFVLTAQSQNIGINATGSAPDGSAMLDVQSTSKGLLVPRMTAAQRSAIASPATSLLVYQTDGAAGFYYNSGTSSTPNWVQLPNSLTAGWLLTGNSGTTPSTHFVGTTDNQPLMFRVNNLPAGKISVEAEGNTFFGYNSGSNISSGQGNSFFGRGSGTANTTGAYNTGNGILSLAANTSGFANTAFGGESLRFNTTGNYNTALGSVSMFTNTTGANNTAVGRFSLFSNTTGNDNTVIGMEAMYQNTSGFSNVAVGKGALYRNTTLMELVAVGELALYNNGVGATDPSHGRYNVAIGSKALQQNNTGFGNTAVGWGSLRENTSGRSNTAVGMQSLIQNTTGIQNTAIGLNTLFYNTTGNYNTATGYQALLENVTGSFNAAFGYSALRDNFGDYNAAFGSHALANSTSSSQRNTSNLSNATAVGARAKVDCNNCLVLGSVNGVGSATATVKVGIGVTSPQATLHVANLGDLNNPQLQVQSQNFLGDYARIRLKGVATNPWWDVAGYASSSPASAQLNFYFSIEFKRYG
jgi:trimeric autotransporter adhesin